MYKKQYLRFLPSKGTDAIYFENQRRQRLSGWDVLQPELHSNQLNCYNMMRLVHLLLEAIEKWGCQLLVGVRGRHHHHHPTDAIKRGGERCSSGTG